MSSTTGFIGSPLIVSFPISTSFASPSTVTITSSPTPVTSRFPNSDSSNDDLTSTFFSGSTFTPINLTSLPTFPPAVTEITTTLPATNIATPSSTLVSPSSSSATVVVVIPTSQSGTTTHFRTAAVIVVFSILGLIVLGIAATVTTIIRQHLHAKRKLRQDTEDASAPMLPGSRASGMHEVRSGSRPYGR